MENRIDTEYTYIDQVVNGYNGFIYTVSKEFKIEFMNKTLKDHVGRDATGENCFKLIHGLDEKCSWCVGEKVLTGEPANFELLSPKDNRWYYYVSTPRSDTQGNVVAQQLIAIDIHDRKLRENQLERHKSDLQKENRILKSASVNSIGFKGIIAQSSQMQEIYSLILEVAQSDASVLIFGESGTGKELIANAIHNLSPFKEMPFLPVNCGGIPETLIESEFFGYKKGAFTGAHIDKSGFLEIADGGTLFLDEIGEINLNMQVKLLRAIDGDGFTPLGSNQTLKPKIRIISATNRDLDMLVKNGQMRSDFFYRVNVVPLHLPPLRNRREDIPLLIYHFLKKFCSGKTLPHIPPHILHALEQYDWPGNVRELQNIIHRYVALGRLDIFNSFLGHRTSCNNLDIGSKFFQKGGGSVLSDEMRNYEKMIISQCLKQNNWKQSKAAEMLGINRKTLYSKIKKYKIKKSEKFPIRAI